MPGVKKVELKAETVKRSTANRLPATAKLSTVTAKKAEVGSRKTVDGRLLVPVYSLTGRETGTLSLPKEIFGAKVNKELIAQAMRVYLNNQKTLSGSTKTRGEVAGSTAKIWAQKGTGRARHGAIRAPIFVGGGIAFGPKPRQVRLDLPKKMKKAALISALSAKLADKNIIGLSGIEKASGKTKEMAELMSSVFSRQPSDKKKKSASVLIITAEKMDNVVRAVRNIPGVNVLPINLINAYEVLRHKLLMVTKEAVVSLQSSVVSRQPSVVSRLSSVVSRQSSVVSRQSSVVRLKKQMKNRKNQVAERRKSLAADS